MRLALLALFALAVPQLAEAEHLHGRPADQGDHCCDFKAEVLRWTPAEGPLAAFISNAYFEQPRLLIAIGYDAQGFWTAEGDPGTDACGDCGRLWLRHTTFAGGRTSFELNSARDGETTEQRAKRKPAIKQKIFALAKGPLDLSALRHDYVMRGPDHDRDGKIEKFSGWFAEVSKKDGSLLRFAQVGKRTMCWLDTTWHAYTLAPPKKTKKTK